MQPKDGAFPLDEFHREGYALGKELVERRGEFTAIFAFNDPSAIGAMRALHEAGLRVPEDVSVVGFDDIDSAAFHNPGLTTIRQPLRSMGAIAARSLLDHLSGGERVGAQIERGPGAGRPAVDGSRGAVSGGENALARRFSFETFSSRALPAADPSVECSACGQPARSARARIVNAPQGGRPCRPGSPPTRSTRPPTRSTWASCPRVTS